METEYKFRFADDGALQEMLQVDRMAGILFGPIRTVLVSDRYLDTARGTLLQDGYSCRLRGAHSGDRLITIKSLVTSTSALHVREEIEVRLPPDSPVGDVDLWPQSAARDLVADLIDHDTLEELFTFNQERFQRLLPAGESPAVELSFDHVSLGGPDAPVLCWLEAELLAPGSSSLLTQVVEEMRQTWALIPETRAKFWWALAAMRPDLMAEPD